MIRRPRFSEMLGSRRRQLGLSIQQASSILRLREDVLVAFEEGDFERMPQSGYAQGMLSSYARYLGLNPRQITDLFQEELYEYVNGSTSHELRRHTRDVQAGRGVRGYDVVNEAGSRPKAYVEYHALLPASGGPAGDLGAFATTTSATPRRSMPLAGSGPSAAEAYNSQSFEQDTAGARRRRPYNGNTARYPGEASGSNRAERQRRRNSQRRRYEQQSDPSRRLLSSDMRGPGINDSGYSGERYLRDEVSTRAVRPREYTDDMRYDEGTRPYERASTIRGRRSSMNIADTGRPNVRRRTGSDYAPAQRGGAGGGRQGGRGGRSPRPSAVSQNKIFIGILVLAVVLTAIIVFSVSSCVGGKNTTTPGAMTSDSGSSAATGQSQGTSSAQTTAQQTSASKDSQSAKTGDDASGADASKTKDGETYVPTVVKVSVSAGSYTWLEVTSDGKSDVADSVTGPWEKEYTVTDAITVQAGNPSAVTVTKNGASVPFNSKASGLGSLSIKGTKPPEKTSDSEASKTDASGTDSTGESGSDSGSGSSKSGAKSSSGSSSASSKGTSAQSSDGEEAAVE